jgi:AcrR family transcriptional regulator
MRLVKSTGKKGERSRQTRRRILQAAYELFTEQGYGATTLQGIADRAGVAVQTIYFAFGNKPSLLKELVDVTIAGDDEPVPTLQRAWFLDAAAAGTAEAQLRQDSDPRLEVQTAAARSLVTKPGARAHLSVEHAADVLFGLLSPELYLLFVRDRGWTPERWQQWVYDTLHAQLCS